jgi:HPt (histidine-containing phosphotransfer) domain-containing protein
MKMEAIMGNISDALSGGSLPPDFKDYVDVNSGVRRVAGNQVIYARLLKAFLGGAELGKLREQTDRGDVEAAAMTAHGLKGIAGNLSLTKLYETAASFEGQLKQGVCEPGAKDEFFQVADRTKEYVGLLLDGIG